MSVLLTWHGAKMICVPLALMGGTAAVTHKVDRVHEAKRHVTHRKAALPRARAVTVSRERVVVEREACAPAGSGGTVGGGYGAPWGGWPPYAGSFPGGSIFPGGPGGHGPGGGGYTPGGPSIPGAPSYPGKPVLPGMPSVAAPVPEPAVVVSMAVGFAMVGGAVRYKRRKVAA
jgi:hypothetical protein